MKAIISDVPPTMLAWRRQTGADQWDEMWEGVLHMNPPPNRAHQELEYALEAWLRRHWADPNGNRVYHQIALSPVAESGEDWTKNYRTPDLVLLKPEAFHIDRNEYFAGPPTVVVEIHSPGDEALEKLPFYAELGVPEVWIIHRDSREPKLFVLRDDAYQQQSPVDDGRVESPTTDIQFSATPAGKLAIEIADDDASRAELP